MTSVPVYDSALARQSLLRQPRFIWEYRGLLRLLVERNLTVRYKRSVLGVWWTLLNPFLTTGVMWIVFSQVFRFATPGTPYIVYLLSGVLVGSMFGQGVTQVPQAIVNNAGVLTKINVPAEAFALAAAGMGLVNFFFGLAPLLIIQMITGVGIPWTVLLVPVLALFTSALAMGIGLFVASLAVYFHDVFDLTAVGIQLIVYMTPIFYPADIVPERFLPFVRLNPLYAHLRAFRSLVYEGQLPGVMVAAATMSTAVISLAIGVYVFNRSWRNLVVLL